jgi:SAM-dependent methyltransferase
MIIKLLNGSLSSPREKNSLLKKVNIVRLDGKNGIYYQFSLQKGHQVFHENHSEQEGEKRLQELLLLFKQAHLEYENETLHLLANRRGEFRATKKEKVGVNVPTSHNKIKAYPFPEGVIHPFLQAVGIQDKEGKIPYSQRDKFTQINHFIQISTPLLQEFKKPRIIDLCCGKGYLTLALYAYFKGEAEIIGVDRKKEVIEDLNKKVEQLGWSNISFIEGNIDAFTPPFKPDLIVALHACNTATDVAIEQGIKWEAKGLLIAPCCQQELLPTLDKEEWYPLLKWGAIAEKFAALLTDARRGEYLISQGYKTDIIEFVDSSHTGKNLLIRSFKQKNLKSI